MTLTALSALSRPLLLALTCALTLAGCSGGEEDTDTDTDTSSTTAPTSTTDDTTDGTATTSTTADSETTAMTSSSTTEDTDTDSTTGDVGFCDPKAQDCPEGFKCTATNKMAGDYWNENRCVPVMGDGGLGDPCKVLDPNEPGGGTDDCGVGFICLNFDDELNGACTEFCNPDDECSSGKGLCDPSVNEGILPICLLTCDPLSQNCPAGQACYGDQSLPDFICFVPDPKDSPGTENAFCAYTNQCLAGFHCVDPATAVNCDPGADGCCTPFCDITEDPGPCEDGESCVAFYEDPPPQYMDVGICVIP
jgi:hypothetical protein